jgi:peptide/nickel transport system substrate-binding protein
MDKMKVSMRQMVGLTLIVFIMLLLSISGVKAASQQYGGIMKVVDMAEGAAPIGAPWENNTIDTKLMGPVIETLYREDPSGKVYPHLATDYKLDLENKTLTFNLRKGIKFHDGTDFNAEAARWCYQKGIDAKIAAGWESVEAVGDSAIRIHFKNYQNDFLGRACGRSFGMISPTAFNKNGIEWARWHPVGTGPFKFVKFQRGNILEYTKNENYWVKGKPYLDGISFLFIRDPMTQQAALLTKDPEQRVDVLSVTSGEQAAMMKAQGFQVLSMPIGPVSLIPDSANADSPLSNRKVREAISYAIDREGIVKARGFGIWKPAYQFQPDNMPTYIPNFQGTLYNPQKAKQLLTEAGYPNGFKTKLIVMPAMVDRDAMVAVQRNLAAIGIQAEMEFPDMGGYMNYRFQGWSNGFMCQHTRALANFNSSFSIYFLPAYKQFPSLKRTDGLIEMIEASNRSPEPSSEKGQPMERLIAQDTMVIPLYYVYELYITRSTVHDTGYTEWSGATIFKPEDAWLSKE